MPQLSHSVAIDISIFVLQQQSNFRFSSRSLHIGEAPKLLFCRPSSVQRQLTEGQVEDQEKPGQQKEMALHLKPYLFDTNLYELLTIRGRTERMECPVDSNFSRVALCHQESLMHPMKSLHCWKIRYVPSPISFSAIEAFSI